ncbi:MAG: hypothetical protein AAGG44_07665, partial [Planctomycetota bacterium]
MIARFALPSTLLLCVLHPFASNATQAATPIPIFQEQLTARLKSTPPETLAKNINQMGDAARGAVLFHRATMQCGTCHAVDQSSSPLGPNLANWNEEPTVEHLIQSILDPSAKVNERYQTLQLLTEDEQIVTGILKAESEDSLALFDATRPGQTIDFAKDNLSTWKTTTQS